MLLAQFLRRRIASERIHYGVSRSSFYNLAAILIVTSTICATNAFKHAFPNSDTKDVILNEYVVNY